MPSRSVRYWLRSRLANSLIFLFVGLQVHHAAMNDSVGYIIVVWNTGPGTASNVTLDDPLPGGLNWTTGNPDCTITSGTLHCAFGDLGVTTKEQSTASVTLTADTTREDCGSLLEVLISLGVVAATAALALIIIRIGLRPLQRMARVAQDIAAGDLTRRVEPATQDTEIGRLGIALNGMLSQIEAAFGERTRSEQRLRRFIADASHELRTPLTSVRGYAEMLRRGAQESPEDASIARRRIEEESVRMSLMVDDMLVLARLGQGRPLERVPVDLQSIARDAVADAHAVAPQRSITLDARAPVVITGDDTRLRQAVGNLMRNALVHTPNATAIEVALETHDGVATMSVVDHGPGLKPDDAGRVFEPFYRADASRSRDSGGAGLGLSIVAAVVDAHGGSVKVSETPGGGATFEVALPIAKA